MEERARQRLIFPRYSAFPEPLEGHCIYQELCHRVIHYQGIGLAHNCQ